MSYLADFAVDYVLPLLIIALPLGLGWLLYRPACDARRRILLGDYTGALQRYRVQHRIVRRFPYLEGLRPFFLPDARAYPLREMLLLYIAEIHFDLGQFDLAANALWRCLALNAANPDALDLLDQIRTQSPNRLIGW
jgi:hypothetical protein